MHDADLGAEAGEVPRALLHRRRDSGIAHSRFQGLRHQPDPKAAHIAAQTTHPVPWRAGCSLLEVAAVAAGDRAGDPGDQVRRARRCHQPVLHGGEAERAGGGQDAARGHQGYEPAAGAGGPSGSGLVDEDRPVREARRDDRGRAR